MELEATPKMSNPPTEQELIVHICKIIELDDQEASSLKSNQIKSVRRLTTTTLDIYQDLISKPNSPITSADVGQINMFRIWYTDLLATKGKPSNQGLANELTEASWD